jgi:hypothetical protein
MTEDSKTLLSSILSVTPLDSFLDFILKSSSSLTSSSLTSSSLLSAGYTIKNSTTNSIEIEAIAKALYTLYHDCLSKAINETSLKTRLSKLGLDVKTTTVIVDAYSRGRYAAISSARTSIATNSSTSTLDDFDWTLSHVVSSATLKAVEEQSVTLSLTLNQTNNGNNTKEGDKEVVRVELSPIELDALIGELEVAASRAGAIVR